MNKQIDIFADGSCIDNGKPNAVGGWAFVITLPEDTEVITEQYGKIRAGKQTNNRAELEACYQALKWIDEQESNGTQYRVFSDSEVVVNGINGLVGRNANRDIWEGVEMLCKKLTQENKLGTNSIQNIDGHNTDSKSPRHIMQCYADKLAKKGANSLLIEPVKI